ncbi:MAG TPA: ABC transporter permease [Thermomicrobiales bacterium]|jgi:molybdate transport system permease protein
MMRVLEQPAEIVETGERMPLPRRHRRGRRGLSVQFVLLGVCSFALLVLLLLPLYAIFWKSLPHGVLFSAFRLAIVRDALRLSLVTTAIALGITLVLGTPIAYLLARYRFPGYGLLDSIIDLPMVLPPSVAGLGLLIAFGRRGLVGGPLEALGITLPFTTASVVMAQCFVAAPFYIKAAKAGFAGVDRELEMVAATFGSSPWYTFTRITLPLAFPSLLGGMVMMWSRALGEFGATIFFAGNYQGVTQTIPLAIFQEEQASHFDTALAMSAVLVCVSFAILVTVKWLTARLLINDEDTLRPIARR